MTLKACNPGLNCPFIWSIWQLLQRSANWVLPRAASPGNATPDDELLELLEEDELLEDELEELDAPEDEALELLDDEVLLDELLELEEELLLVLDELLLEELLLDELLLDEELLGITTTPDELLDDELLLDELLELDELLLEEDELEDEELADELELPVAAPLALVDALLLDDEDPGGLPISGDSGGELLQAAKAAASTRIALSFALSHITASYSVAPFTGPHI